MSETTKKFGLRHKASGKMLGVSTSANHCDAVEISHTLYEGQEPLWLVNSATHAEYVRNFSTAWYNAGYSTPSHSFEAEELEVVEYEVTISVAPVEVRIPTVREFFKIKYAKKEPQHYEYLMKLLDDGQEIDYMLYDLASLKGYEFKY